MFWVHQYHQYHTGQFLCCECCKFHDPLLEHDLDLECLPLLGRWCLSVLLPQAGVLPLHQSWPWPLLLSQSAARTEMILKTAFVAFFAKCWTVFVWVHCVALATCFAVFTTWTTSSMWAAGSCAFLTVHLKVLITSIVVGCVIPQFDLWQLKSFTIISCSLAYWSRAWYVMSPHHFFDLTHFFTSKCLVAWKRSSVLHTSFLSVEYWHLLTGFLIHWSSWSVDSLSPCFISLYISLNMIPVWHQDFKGVCYGLETSLWIFLGFLICWDG